MAYHHKICPLCQEEGTVDDGLKCSKCGNQLEYTDGQGTLGVQSATHRCNACHAENSRESLYCESCGRELTQPCPLCKGRHPVNARVCAKYGEPLRKTAPQAPHVVHIIRDSFNLVRSRYKKAAFLPLALLLLFSGYFVYDRYFSSGGGGVIPSGRPSIDVVFVIDSTGSMADEIQVIKEKVKEMGAKIMSGQPAPFVRYGLVTFRDRGDEYVVKKFDFTDSIDRFQTSVNTLSADGGGDTQESVNEALDVAMNGMTWDSRANTKKLIFLIGDAGPHRDYHNGLDYQSEAAEARSRGIKIYSLGCSGIEEDGEPEFREIAQATGGTFEFLTYRQQYVDDRGATYYRLKAGDKVYSPTSAMKGDSWKDGVKTAIDRGLVREELNPACSAPGSGGILNPSCPSPGREVEMDNNIDSVLTKAVQQDAESIGVKYRK